MAEVEDSLPPNIVSRRKGSVVDHINRIRGANSKRQVVPWWLMREKETFPLTSKPDGNDKSFNFDSELDRRFHISPLKDSFGQDDAVRSVSSSASFKSLDNARMKEFKAPVPSRSNSKVRRRRKPRSARTLKRKADRNSSTKTYKNVRAGQKRKTGKLNDRNSSTAAEDNSNRIQEHVRTDPERKAAENALDFKNISQWLQENVESLKRPVTLKNMIVLKWLHDLNIPDRKFDYEETEEYPIKLLKGSLDPAASPVLLNAPVKSTSRIIKSKSKTGLSSKEMLIEEKKNNWSLTEVNYENENKPGFEENFKQSPVNSQSSIAWRDNTDVMKAKSKEFENSEGTGLLDKVPHEAEMFVTELGKLQIVMDFKSFKPDDAAVIIWLNEIPKSFLKPDYRKRLSVTSFNDVREAAEGVSTPHLEDTASKTAPLYFPPVSVLKNLVVDSKGELQKTKDGAVFYKRCNLLHVDSVHS